MGKSLVLTEIQVLLPFFDADEDNPKFGRSVAVQGGTIVVGEPGRDLARKGGATIFARAGDAWVEQAQIAPADLRAHDWFGSHVAVQGDTALVSAPGRRVGHVRGAGTVWVYVRQGGAWNEQARLTSPSSPSPGTAETFGYGLALQGDEAFVGDYRAVRVYRRQGKTWSLTATVTGAQRRVHVVSVHVDTLVFDQFRDLFVFTRTGAGWTKQQTLSLPADQGSWVKALACDGNTIVAGVPTEEVGDGAFAGAVYVFGRPRSRWVQQTVIEPDKPVTFGHFGTGVAVNGGAVLVGEPGGDQVHVFRRTAGKWRRGSLTLGPLGSDLGTSLAWDKETVVAGAPRYVTDPAPNAPRGAAIVYKPEQKLIPPSLARWAAVMRVLFGVIGGGGGLGVTPGGQPIPIDPEESLRRWQRLSPARRERTLARLIGEAGGLVRDPRSRRELERIATTLLRKTRPDEAIILRRRVRRSPPR